MTCKTDFSAVMKQITSQADKMMRDALKECGERAIRRIESTRTYHDVTGNLTASIGYGVIWDGSLYATGGFGGGEGGTKGMEVLLSAAKDIVNGLIIVAGMDYALYVERKGYVVLDGGTLEISRDMAEILKDVRL